MLIKINTTGIGSAKTYTAFKKIITQNEDDYIYSRWICKDGFRNFIEDVGEKPPVGKWYFVKKDNKKPYSSNNFEWKEMFRVKKIRSERILLDHVIKITHPPRNTLKKAGIYKMTFDNGCFYIGSSKNIWMRIGLYRSSFNGTGKIHNKRLIQCMVDCSSVDFQVLEYVTDGRIDAETKFIHQHTSNPLLLNRAYNASSNKGIKWTSEEKIKIRRSLFEKLKKSDLKSNKNGRIKNAYGYNHVFKSKLLGDKEDNINPKLLNKL